MLYRVGVESSKGFFNLDFELDNNPLVDIWLDCVKTQLSNPWKVNHLQWRRCWTTEETLAKARRDLKVCCLELGINPKLDINTHHAMFQSYYENGGAPSELWDRLNQRIHKIEEQERSINNPTAQRTGFGMVISERDSSHVEQRPIPPELRSLWGHVPRSGELLLGYYTLGKTIADCVRDNDIECVKTGGVRPQQQISTETMCLWSPTPSITKRVLSITQIAQWVKVNNLEEYVDLNLPENQYAGAPRLGTYVGSYTPDEINEYLSTANIVAAELID
jgi:hypothetical protein